MDKWEYKTDDKYCFTRDEVDEWLNKKGQEGWEAIMITRSDFETKLTVIFKRKIK